MIVSPSVRICSRASLVGTTGTGKIYRCLRGWKAAAGRTPDQRSRNNPHHTQHTSVQPTTDTSSNCQASMRTGLSAAVRLSAGCWCLSLALLSFSVLVTAQFDDDEFDSDVTTTNENTMQDINLGGDSNSNNNNNNNSMRCWSCVAKFRTWADCQNLDEVEYCENPDVTSCMKSSIRIEGLLGRDTRYHRLAGCGLNKTALRDHFLEFFEITFDESDGVTLEEFTTCEGSLCNVMDEEALKRGKWRTVNGNLITTGAAVGGLPSKIALLMSVVLAIRSFV